ncbi:unnamed protein product, partial [Rotaria sordida]
DGITYINNPLGYVEERQTGLIEPPYELYQINRIKLKSSSSFNHSE